RVVYAEAGSLYRASGAGTTALLPVEDVPITFAARARYNVQNAGGAIAMAWALGMPDDAIVRGLRGFLATDNPRPGHVVERGGVRIMLDFGHNAEGVRAVLELAAALREGSKKDEDKGRLFVIAGSAGDRSDHEIAEMGRIISEHAPHRVFLRDLGGY